MSDLIKENAADHPHALAPSLWSSAPHSQPAAMPVPSYQMPHLPTGTPTSMPPIMMPMQPCGYPLAPSGVFPAQFQPLLPPTTSANLKRLRPSDLSGGTIAFNGTISLSTPACITQLPFSPGVFKKSSSTQLLFNEHTSRSLMFLLTPLSPS
jgi:hypothetical protein